MAYSIIISSRAQLEIENAIDYYALYSATAPSKFVNALQKAYNNLEQNPFNRIYYREVRAIKLDKFPYLLYYVTNETRQTVRVLSCFHHKRDPNNRPGL